MEIETYLGRVDPALRADESEPLEELYDHSRKAVWSLLRVRAGQEELEAWRSAFERVTVKAGRTKSNSSSLSSFIVRIQVLQDLLSEDIFFSARHPLQDVLERPHVKSILSAIHNAGGEIERSKLLEVTRLGSPNLSRLLSILEASDLARRPTTSTRQKSVQLTAAAKALLSKSVETSHETVGESKKSADGVLASPIVRAKRLRSRMKNKLSVQLSAVTIATPSKPAESAREAVGDAKRSADNAIGPSISRAKWRKSRRKYQPKEVGVNVSPASGTLVLGTPVPGVPSHHRINDTEQMVDA